MMKNVSVKILAGIGALSLAAGVYSFASNDEPKDKKQQKYEVIRMVDGEMMQFDTTVYVASGYSPQDYLNDLGFGDDEDVSIVDLSHFEHNEFVGTHFEHEGDVHGHDGQMVFIEIDEEGDDVDGKEHEIRIEKKIIMEGDGNEFIHENGDVEMIIIDENGNVIENDGNHEIKIEKKMINGDGEEFEFDGDPQIKIEKRIIINEDGEEEVEVDVNAIMDELNIDSLIKVAMELEGVEGDSHNVFIHKMIISDDEVLEDKHLGWTEMDTDGADFHKEIHGNGHHMSVAVWGDEEEDFTLLIVSDVDESGDRSAQIKEESGVDMKLFPNPATKNAQLQLSIEDKAATEITVTDVKGRTIQKLNIGEYQGAFTHDFDVKKWAKGVYFVHVQTGDKKITEKLVVE